MASNPSFSPTCGLLRLLIGQGTGDTNGDWGEVDSREAKENEISLQSGLRLLSSYITVTGVLRHMQSYIAPCDTPLLAKPSKSFSLINTFSFGGDRM
jgi:hypothetical protein